MRVEEEAQLQTHQHVSIAGAVPAASATSGNVQLPSTEFYFYQSADGQCVFLHPLVSRALLAHYGSYAACPSEVSHAITPFPSLCP